MICGKCSEWDRADHDHVGRSTVFFSWCRCPRYLKKWTARKLPRQHMPSDFSSLFIQGCHLKDDQKVSQNNSLEASVSQSILQIVWGSIEQSKCMVADLTAWLGRAVTEYLAFFQSFPPLCGSSTMILWSSSLLVVWSRWGEWRRKKRLAKRKSFYFRLTLGKVLDCELSALSNRD